MVIITNESLSPDDWKVAFERMRLYSRYFFLDGNKIYHPSKYSMTKNVYSPVIGSLTNEYNAFCLILNTVLGEYRNAVKIENQIK